MAATLLRRGSREPGPRNADAPLLKSPTSNLSNGRAKCPPGAEAVVIHTPDGAGVLYRRRRGSGSDQTMGARQMTGNIDLLHAELKVAQTECDDIDTAIAQIAADDADAKAKFIELSERRKIAGERLSRISTALTEARSGSA